METESDSKELPSKRMLPDWREDAWKELEFCGKIIERHEGHAMRNRATCVLVLGVIVYGYLNKPSTFSLAQFLILSLTTLVLFLYLELVHKRITTLTIRRSDAVERIFVA